ncbi:MAG: hypothetical protein OXC61_04105 [Flavobacteriaceae bacterium]|nr:hypothetical protein [Flavobacteriaceae bacterium]
MAIPNQKETHIIHLSSQDQRKFIQYLDTFLPESTIEIPKQEDLEFSGELLKRLGEVKAHLKGDIAFERDPLF